MWKTTIGLEVHAELKTQTKMFCDSRNDPDEKRPNVNVCPVCMGHPGTLPVINRKAVEHVLRVGTALGGTTPNFTEFDRKNYFYPDIPKGYQISQYKYPLVSGGSLNGVAITRVHLEEDTARSQHEGGESLVDYNRAGVPLMELVTEPVMHSAEDAGAFARELQLLLRTLGVSDADMEKGQMRVEANISVGKDGKLGTKVEVKNLNSFRSVEQAIAYETKRQIELLEKGGVVVQETRGFDESKGTTFSQRKKESSHDYRYFPEPDLPKLYLSEIPEFANDVLKATLPELPWEKRKRYLGLGLKADDVEMFLRDQDFGSFFDSVSSALSDKEELLMAANYIASDIAGMVSAGTLERDVIRKAEAARSFADLIGMVSRKEITSRVAKDMLPRVLSGEDPETIAAAEGLGQQSDRGAIEKIAQEIIDANPKVVADYKAGKQTALQFLVGQGMKATRGSANPEILREVFAALLS